MPQDPQSFLQWAVGGIIMMLLGALAWVVRGYERRISKLEEADQKIRDDIETVKTSDRARWERFEDKIDAKFEDLRSLVITLRNPASRP